MILVFGAIVLLAGAASAAAAVFGVPAPFTIPWQGFDAPFHGWLIATMVAILVGFLAALRLPKPQRFVSLLTLDAAFILCVLAALLGEPMAAIQPSIVSASSRFWTLFDLVMYSVIGLVLMNAGLFSRRGGRGDDDDRDRR